MKISHKIPLIATSVILTAFATFSAFQYRLIKENIYTQTESNLNETSGLISANISQWLNERLMIMSNLSEQIGTEISKEKILRTIGEKTIANRAAYYYAVLEDGSGGMISNADLDIPSDWDGRTRPWYKLALTTTTAMMTEPYEDSIDKRLLITAVKPLLNDKGVLGADIELKTISDAINAIDFNGTGYAYLVNEKGKIITYPNSSQYGRNINEIYTVPPQPDEKLQENSIENKDVLTSFYPLKQFDSSTDRWMIGITIDKNKILAPAQELIINAAIAALITAIIASLFFYFFMLLTLIKPVHRLAEQSNEISLGKLEQEIEGVTRKDEIGELSQAVQRMQKALRMAMNRLNKQ